MGLDKFYTKKEQAKKCYEFLLTVLPEVEYKDFLEPSAGCGNFLDYLNNYLALDILPEDDRIQQQDFLTFDTNKVDYVSIGNPPFGKRSKLAIDFFNKAANFCEVIAWIVPVSFMKWGVQKELASNWKLLDYIFLDPNSFTDEGVDFSVRTVFQIWVKANSIYDNGKNCRLLASLPIEHTDFNIWQYNATPQALKTVEENWTIATYRQGYHDYNQIFTKKDYDFIKQNMTGIKKQQFFFIEPLTEESKKIILSMDFNNLAARNTSTPGYGKGDFVSYYMELKNKSN